jgi:hypothetical protein
VLKHSQRSIIEGQMLLHEGIDSSLFPGHTVSSLLLILSSSL